MCITAKVRGQGIIKSENDVAKLLNTYNARYEQVVIIHSGTKICEIFIELFVKYFPANR